MRIIKRFVAALLIMILGVNMGFCQSENNTNNTELTKEEIQKLIDTYKDDISRIIKKEPKEMSSDKFLKFIKEFGYPIPEDSIYSAEKIGRIELPLNDGDYAVWNSKIFGKRMPTQYAAEYHKDKQIMGIVKMERVDKTRSVFYEYRLKEPYSYYDKDFSRLKHIMIHYDNGIPITFVVTTDGNIKGILYKGQVFSKDLENVVNIQKLDMTSLNSPNASDIGNDLGNSIVGITQGVGVILTLPVALIAMPFVFFNPNNYK